MEEKFTYQKEEKEPNNKFLKYTLEVSIAESGVATIFGLYSYLFIKLGDGQFYPISFYIPLLLIVVHTLCMFGIDKLYKTKLRKVFYIISMVMSIACYSCYLEGFHIINAAFKTIQSTTNNTPASWSVYLLAIVSILLIVGEIARIILCTIGGLYIPYQESIEDDEENTKTENSINYFE